MKVFLGGTCAESTWRQELISMLEPHVEYFNPVVPDWNDAAQKRELEERKNCDYCLYVITPRMQGVYSIAEVIDDANKRYEKTIFCFLTEDGDFKFNDGQIRSLDQVKKMVERNGGKTFDSLQGIANFLNHGSHVNTKKTLCFFDTEFTGLKKSTNLLSIGLIMENGQRFYAEITDYPTIDIEPWIKENVISKMKFNGESNIHNVSSDGSIEMKSTFRVVRASLNTWLKQYSEIGIQFVSDCITYDHMLIIDLISGHALKMPEFISSYCHDINQDISRFYNISDEEAFDIDRNKICNREHEADGVHNALVDAIHIKDIYNMINR